MNDTERAKLVHDLTLLGNYLEIHDYSPHLVLVRIAAARIQSDGLRLKAQSEMANTLNDTMEQALSALAVFKREVSR